MVTYPINIKNKNVDIPHLPQKQEWWHTPFYTSVDSDLYDVQNFMFFFNKVSYILDYHIIKKSENFISKIAIFPNMVL